MTCITRISQIQVQNNKLIKSSCKNNVKIGILNNCATPQESLDLLCEVLFPGSGPLIKKLKPNNSIKLGPEDTILFSKENIIKIFGTFGKFRAPGVDGIQPFQLQKINSNNCF